MDRLENYRNTLKNLLEKHKERMNQGSQTEIETTLNFDDERDQYMLLRMGWTPQGRLFVPTLYARLLNGKIWIENDWTEDGLALELVDQGIPRDDVVLAFHPPEMRVHTEFAVS